jgi:peptide deformylase
MDHLEGTLFVDRLRPMLRRDILRRFARRRQA